MDSLQNRIFEIDRAIKAVLPSDELMEWFDSGMYIARDSEINTLWRDMSFGIDGKEFSFTFSTNGDYKGDLSGEYLLPVLTVLSQYKRNVGLEISNVTGVSNESN
jgi:hypothetical protein